MLEYLAFIFVLICGSFVIILWLLKVTAEIMKYTFKDQEDDHNKKDTV